MFDKTEWSIGFMSLFFDIVVVLIFLQRDRDADRDTHYTVMKRDTP